MSYQIDAKLRSRIEDTSNFDQNIVSQIITQPEVAENGETVLHIRVRLSPNLEINKPSITLGRQLNHIAAQIRTRTVDLPIYSDISFLASSPQV